MADEIQTAFIALLNRMNYGERELLVDEAVSLASTLPTTARQWLTAIKNSPLTPGQMAAKIDWLAAGFPTSTSTQ